MVTLPMRSCIEKPVGGWALGGWNLPVTHLSLDMASGRSAVWGLRDRIQHEAMGFGGCSAWSASVGHAVSSSKGGKLVNGLAEVERTLIQERTRESVEHQRRTGGKIGGRPPLSNGRRELVKRLRDEGKSYRDVAEICGISVTTAHRYGEQA